MTKPTPVDDVLVISQVVQERLQSGLPLVQKLLIVVVFEPALQRQGQAGRGEQLLQLPESNKYSSIYTAVACQCGGEVTTSDTVTTTRLRWTVGSYLSEHC